MRHNVCVAVPYKAALPLQTHPGQNESPALAEAMQVGAGADADVHSRTILRLAPNNNQPGVGLPGFEREVVIQDRDVHRVHRLQVNVLTHHSSSSSSPAQGWSSGF